MRFRKFPGGGKVQLKMPRPKPTERDGPAPEGGGQKHYVIKDVDPEIHEALKEMAAAEDKTIPELLKELCGKLILMKHTAFLKKKRRDIDERLSERAED